MIISTGLSVSCGRIFQTSSELAIEASKTSLVAGESIQLKALNLDTAETVSWSADSGILPVAQSTAAQVTYTAPNSTGDITITLVATDKSNNTRTAKLVIHVTGLSNTLAMPTGVVTKPQDSSVLVSWNRVSGYGYYVFYSDEELKPVKYRIDVGPDSSYAVDGLLNNKKYYFSVSSYNPQATGNISPRSETKDATPVDTTPPMAPSNFKAEIVVVNASKAVKLTWVQPVEPDFRGVIIRRKNSNDPNPENRFPINENDGEPVLPVNFNQSYTEFIDVNVQVGLDYYYSIFSFDDEVPTRLVSTVPANFYVPLSQ